MSDAEHMSMCLERIAAERAHVERHIEALQQRLRRSYANGLDDRRSRQAEALAALARWVDVRDAILRVEALFGMALN